jgi:hypothetical protein
MMRASILGAKRASRALGAAILIAFVSWYFAVHVGGREGPLVSAAGLVLAICIGVLMHVALKSEDLYIRWPKPILVLFWIAVAITLWTTTYTAVMAL